MIIATLDGFFVVTKDASDQGNQNALFYWHCIDEKQVRKLAAFVGAPLWTETNQPFFPYRIALTQGQHDLAIIMAENSIPAEINPVRWQSLATDPKQFALLSDIMNAACTFKIGKR